MKDALVWGAFEFILGAMLLAHCPRAALREYRAGVALGRHGAYPRATRPIRFWAVVVATALAGLLGGVFMLAGVATAMHR